jgi:hypothetical protein
MAEGLHPSHDELEYVEHISVKECGIMSGACCVVRVLRIVSVEK